MDTVRKLDELMCLTKTGSWSVAERNLYNGLVRRIRKLERDEQKLSMADLTFALAS